METQSNRGPPHVGHGADVDQASEAGRDAGQAEDPRAGAAWTELLGQLGWAGPFGPVFSFTKMPFFGCIYFIFFFLISFKKYHF